MTERVERDAVGIYVHIPFCMRKCGYCDFLSGVYGEDVQRRYVDALCAEIACVGGQARREASTVFIGGGTPSWLGEREMACILEQLHLCFSVLPNAEVTLECNPGTVTKEKLAAYKKAGVNRLSIGLQSSNDEELRILGRVHTYERFLRTYDLARKGGFDNINVDVMTALPYQTPDKLARTLSAVIRLRPEHVSAYTLMIEEGTPFYERYQFDAVRQHAGMETEELPNEEEEYRLYKLTQQMLEEAGYERYEISNYAKGGFACRHNVGYWRRRPYIGLGVGAAGFDGQRRVRNISDIYQYMDAVERFQTSCELPAGDAAGWLDKNLSDGAFRSAFWEEETQIGRRDAMAEFMFLGLRMTEGVARNDFAREFGVPIEAVYQEALRRLQEQELLVMSRGRIRLTERGTDVSNYALSAFLLEE